MMETSSDVVLTHGAEMYRHAEAMMESFADSVIPVAQGVFWLFVLLCLSAFCSASETVVTAMPRGRLMALQETKPFYRNMFQWILDDVHHVLTLCLISNNIVNIGASTLATALGLRFFGERSLIFVVPVLTMTIIIFGEIVPKSVALNGGERVILFCAPFLRALGFVIYPITWLTQKAVDALGWLFHLDMRRQNPFVTREEIEQFVNIGEESGALEPVERRMIHGVIDFEEKRVHEIMVPRPDMVTIESSETVGSAVEVFIERGHSRLPVY